MLFVTIVLDGVGIGEAPDADQYGDEGSNTLGHICALERPALPYLAAFGLGNIAPLKGIGPVANPLAHYGKMQEVSAGKDSTTGHWELAGLRLDTPFPTYPKGFPDEVVSAFLAHSEAADILANHVASGTNIIRELGQKHQETGHPILYTSADSVFQLAAHVETIPLPALYAMCEVARHQVCIGPHAVGRVIARPFEGDPGNYMRISAARKDFSRLPHRPPLQAALQTHGVRTVSVGKITDLFGHIGFDERHKTRNNAEGIEATIAAMHAAASDPTPTFIWTNLVDFDQEYGHRNNPAGFAAALEAFDAALPSLQAALPLGGRLVLTADHGNDPTTPSTDHSREYVPLLCYDGKPGQSLGLRTSFNDHAAAVAAYFGVPFETKGISF